MPMRDGTGPLGTGPIGRGLGPCSRGGAGQGGFRRWPGGFGYRHWFHATGFTQRQRMVNLPWREPDVDDAHMSAKQRRQILEAQAAFHQEQLDSLRSQINGLNGSGKETPDKE